MADDKNKSTAVTVAPTRSASVAAAVRKWFASIGATELPVQETASETLARGRRAVGTRDDWDQVWGQDTLGLQFLLGAGDRQGRNRLIIYQTYAEMMCDPVIQSALRLHTTAALGGHESKGQMVFIETSAAAKGNSEAEALVEELQKDLTGMFDRVAPTVTFNGCGFGDAYARIYGEPSVGVRDLYVDELVYPPLVQPYERANTTVGFTVNTGAKFVERLTVLQMARLKMPRMLYVPQDRVMEKTARVSMLTDRLEALPAVPAMVGGSFLDGTESAYRKFAAAWAGLVGQRVQSSVNERIFTVQQRGMTKEQGLSFRARLARLWERRNTFIKDVVSKGKSIFAGIIHIIPVYDDKQLTQINVDGTAAGSTTPYTTEDVMMHARFLAGALGLDLSMIGFSDQLSGGLGDGGFFRVSAQSAERSRAIRAALVDFFDHIIQVHLLLKKGISYEGQEKPWTVSFFSGISALETERQKTKLDQANTVMLQVQVLTALRDLGADEDVMMLILKDEMGMDEETAKKWAKALKKAKEQAAAEAAGGGFGGGPLGGEPGAERLPGASTQPGDEGQLPPGGGAEDGA